MLFDLLLKALRPLFIKPAQQLVTRGSLAFCVSHSCCRQVLLPSFSNPHLEQPRYVIQVHGSKKLFEGLCT